MANLDPDIPDMSYYEDIDGSEVYGIKAYKDGKEFGDLSNISWVITREKAPIYTMGTREPRAFSVRKRGVAGSLVFMCLTPPKPKPWPYISIAGNADPRDFANDYRFDVKVIVPSGETTIEGVRILPADNSVPFGDIQAGTNLMFVADKISISKEVEAIEQPEPELKRYKNDNEV